MIKKVIIKLSSKFLRHKGYSNYMSNNFSRELYEDFFETKISLSKKIWAYKHGFLSKRIFDYDLNESNLNDYIPDFLYYKLHPINRCSTWIDDKLTFRYILQPFSDYLPRYFYEISNGSIYKLLDCPDDLSSTYEDIIMLLERVKKLAVKKTSGSGGIGFYKLDYTNDEYYINNKRTDKIEVIKLLSSLEDYIITEYIISEKSLRKIYDITPNSLRVMAIRNEQTTCITGAFIRFGNSSSGMVDNAFAGGIVCGVNIKDGELYQPKLHKNQQCVDIPVHPDSLERIEGTIKHWKLIVKKIKEIGDYIPQIKYMGYDIIVTDNGFKIIEINSHQSLQSMQMYYPIFKNEYSKKFFNSLLKGKK